MDWRQRATSWGADCCQSSARLAQAAAKRTAAGVENEVSLLMNAPSKTPIGFHNDTKARRSLEEDRRDHKADLWNGESLGWAGLAWLGLGWAGLGWAGLAWPGLACPMYVQRGRPFSWLRSLKGETMCIFCGHVFDK